MQEVPQVLSELGFKEPNAELRPITRVYSFTDQEGNTYRPTPGETYMHESGREYTYTSKNIFIDERGR